MKGKKKPNCSKALETLKYHTYESFSIFSHTIQVTPAVMKLFLVLSTLEHLGWLSFLFLKNLEKLHLSSEVFVLYKFLLSVTQYFSATVLLENIGVGLNVFVVPLAIHQALTIIGIVYFCLNLKKYSDSETTLQSLLSYSIFLYIYIEFEVALVVYLKEIIWTDSVAWMSFLIIFTVFLVVNQFFITQLFFNESFQASDGAHCFFASRYQFFYQLAFKSSILGVYISGEIDKETDGAFLPKAFVLAAGWGLMMFCSFAFPNFMMQEIRVFNQKAIGLCFIFAIGNTFLLWLKADFMIPILFAMTLLYWRLVNNLSDFMKTFFLHLSWSETSKYLTGSLWILKYIILIEALAVNDPNICICNERMRNGQVTEKILLINGVMKEHQKKCISPECLCHFMDKLKENVHRILFFDGATQSYLNGRKLYVLDKDRKNPLLHIVYIKCVMYVFFEGIPVRWARARIQTHFSTYMLRNFYKGIIGSLIFRTDRNFLNVPLDFAIYCSIKMGNSYFNQMNVNKLDDPSISNIDIKGIHHLESQCQCLKKEVKNYVENLSKLLSIQNNQGIVYVSELYPIFQEIIKSRKKVMDFSKTNLRDNPMALKTLIPVYSLLLHKKKIAKKMISRMSNFHTKIENYKRQSQIFYEIELLYEENAILIAMGAMAENRGNVILFNSGAVSSFEVPEKSILNKNITALMPRVFSIHHNEFLATYLKTGRENVLFRERVIVARKSSGEGFLSAILVKPNLRIRTNSFDFMGFLKPVRGKCNFFLVDNEGIISSSSGKLLEALNITKFDDFEKFDFRVDMLIPDLSFLFNKAHEGEKKRQNTNDKLSRAATLKLMESSQELNLKIYVLKSTDEYVKVFGLNNAQSKGFNPLFLKTQKTSMEPKFLSPKKRKHNFGKPLVCQVLKACIAYDKINYKLNTQSAYVIKVLKLSYHSKRNAADNINSHSETSSSNSRVGPSSNESHPKIRRDRTAEKLETVFGTYNNFMGMENEFNQATKMSPEKEEQKKKSPKPKNKKKVQEKFKMNIRQPSIDEIPEKNFKKEGKEIAEIKRSQDKKLSEVLDMIPDSSRLRLIEPSGINDFPSIDKTTKFSILNQNENISRNKEDKTLTSFLETSNHHFLDPNQASASESKKLWSATSFQSSKSDSFEKEVTMDKKTKTLNSKNQTIKSELLSAKSEILGSFGILLKRSYEPRIITRLKFTSLFYVFGLVLVLFSFLAMFINVVAYLSKNFENFGDPNLLITSIEKDYTIFMYLESLYWDLGQEDQDKFSLLVEKAYNNTVVEEETHWNNTKKYDIEFLKRFEDLREEFYDLATGNDNFELSLSLTENTILNFFEDFDEYKEDLNELQKFLQKNQFLTLEEAFEISFETIESLSELALSQIQTSRTLQTSSFYSLIGFMTFLSLSCLSYIIFQTFKLKNMKNIVCELVFSFDANECLHFEEICQEMLLNIDSKKSNPRFFKRKKTNTTIHDSMSKPTPDDATSKGNHANGGIMSLQRLKSHLDVKDSLQNNTVKSGFALQKRAMQKIFKFDSKTSPELFLVFLSIILIVLALIGMIVIAKELNDIYVTKTSTTQIYFVEALIDTSHLFILSIHYANGMASGEFLDSSKERLKNQIDVTESQALQLQTYATESYDGVESSTSLEYIVLEMPICPNYQEQFGLECQIDEGMISYIYDMCESAKILWLYSASEDVDLQEEAAQSAFNIVLESYILTETIIQSFDVIVSQSRDVILFSFLICVLMFVGCFFLVFFILGPLLYFRIVKKSMEEMEILKKIFKIYSPRLITSHKGTKSFFDIHLK